MLLFLDFDGVMHPRVTKDEPVFCRLPLLEAWLRDQPQVDVLISSSWREFHPFDEMVSYFSDDLQPRIIGKTPVASHMLGPLWTRSGKELELGKYERQFEIESWLRESDAPNRPWLALDDEPTLFEPGCSNLVLVNHRTGLKPGNLFKLSQKLLAHSAG